MTSLSSLFVITHCIFYVPRYVFPEIPTSLILFVDAGETDNSAIDLEHEGRITQDKFLRPTAHLSETCNDAIGGISSLHLSTGSCLGVTILTSPAVNVAKNDANKIANRSLQSQIRSILDPAGQASQSGVRVRPPAENNTNRQHIARDTKINGSNGAMDMQVILPVSISD